MREQRLLTCVFVSLTLHTTFLAFVPPLGSRTTPSLKRPLWVDLVELKEMSPPVSPPTASPSAVVEPRLVGPVLEKREQKPRPQHRKSPSAPVPPLRPLPSVDRLVPSLNSLLKLQRASDDPLSVEPSLDDGEGIHEGSAFDAYLRQIEEAVKKNWRVSDDEEIRRGTTVIRISIDSEGTLASIDLLESSGMILHDYEALDAVKQSFPLPPPPESLLDENGKLSIRFSFHYFLAPPG